MYYPEGTILYLKEHETHKQIREMPIIIKENARVVLSVVQYIDPEVNNPIYVTVYEESSDIVWNDRDYGIDRFTNVLRITHFSIISKNIKKIEFKCKKD